MIILKKNSLYDLIDFMKKRKLDVAFLEEILGFDAGGKKIVDSGWQIQAGRQKHIHSEKMWQATDCYSRTVITGV